MQITNEFTVPLPPHQAWPLLLDLQRVAPCLPGATITSVDGDEYEGRAKIKVGPITAEYKGTARFLERDQANFRATLRASGKDARGQGNVSADIGLQLVEHESGSTVLVDTEMDISGKIAQFGRGVINDAAGAILGIFAERLGEMMIEDQAPAVVNSPGMPREALSAPAHRGHSDNTDDTLDLVKLARSARSNSSSDTAGVAGVSSQVAWVPALVAALAAIISIFAAGYSAGVNRR